MAVREKVTTGAFTRHACGIAVVAADHDERVLVLGVIPGAAQRPAASNGNRELAAQAALLGAAA